MSAIDSRAIGIRRCYWICKLRNAPSDEHGVEDDAERPHVGRSTGVRPMGSQDLGRYVGRAPALVLKEIFLGVVQNYSILQRLEL